MGKGELHLMIIWERARYKQKEIIDDLSNNIKIVEAFEIEWSQEAVSNNFTRFYGVKLPNHSFKEKECGTGKFILLLLWDNNPRYESRETSRGCEVVNTKMFDLKSKYRLWTGGGHKIHATNSPEEVNHDLTLLLGITYDEYVSTRLNQVQLWDNNYTPLQRNLTGYEGWKTIEEFFHTINNTSEYIVLRGGSHFVSYNEKTPHTDIDILVKDYKSFILICKPYKQLYGYDEYHKRTKIEIQVNGKKYLLDLWSTHINYFSSKWIDEMFASKVKKGLFYKLSPENEFYTMVYHCLYRKNHTSDDYLPWFKQNSEKLAIQIGIDSSLYKNTMDLCYVLLITYMESRGYAFTYVQYEDDRNCFNRNQIPKIKEAWDYLVNTNKLGLTNIIPYKVDEATSLSGYLYFIANNANDDLLFIKFGGIGDSCLNEISKSLLMHSIASSHFFTPIFYSEIEPYYVSYRFVLGNSIEDAIKNNYLDSKQAFCQLEEIRHDLLSKEIVHRDIKPDNFIYLNGQVYLLDLQFALCKEQRELSCFKEFPSVQMQLGGQYRYERYAWNDSYSFNKLYCNLGLSSQAEDVFDKKETLRMSSLSILRYLFSRLIYHIKMHIKARFEPRQKF